MSLCQVTLSANAGLALSFGGVRLWIDALHDRKVPGFSTVTPDLWTAMKSHPGFAAPDMLFFTHCHPDHFSPELTQRALERWPQARPILPENRFPGQLLLSGRRERLRLPDLTLDFIRLPHEGSQYAGVPHYGCILESRDLRILVTGDCKLCAPELADFLAEDGPIDLAILDFPWLTLPRGRRFIQEHIRPKTLLVCHLPFSGDDVCGYRTAAFQSAPQLGNVEIRFLSEPLQQETLEDA